MNAMRWGSAISREPTSEVALQRAMDEADLQRVTEDFARAARLAGTNVAIKATATRNNGTATNVTASVPLMP